MASDNSSILISSLQPTGNTSLNNLTGVTYETFNNATSSPKDPLIVLTVPAIMFASGVFGNVIAILVLLRSSRDHKQTVFYRLVGALALTDLFGTCATSPVTLAVYANNLKWVGGDHLCNYESFMFVFVSCTTIFIIGTMAMDRVLAISAPFFYEQHFTYSRAKYFILSLWGFAALMGCLPLIGLGEVVKQFPGTWCFFSFTSAEIENQIFAYGYACIGLFMICLTGIANVIVTLILLKMRRAAARTMNVGCRKRKDSELQMMVLMLGVITVFATCWCPFLIRILINQINKRQVDVRADLHALRLASLNQILDPWVYILFRKEFFKRTYLFIKERIFGGCKCFLHISANARSLSRRTGTTQVADVDDAYAHAHAQGYSSEYVPLDEKENVEIQIKNSNSVVNGKNGFKQASIRSQSNSNSHTSEESSLLKISPETVHKCNLHMKHSACLFCFANHPKKLTMLNLQDRLSVGKLNLLADNSDKGHIMVNVKFREPYSLKSSMGKRQSIHLSLEDVRAS